MEHSIDLGTVIKVVAGVALIGYAYFIDWMLKPEKKK
jgi:hypothetical protein